MPPVSFKLAKYYINYASACLLAAIRALLLTACFHQNCFACCLHPAICVLLLLASLISNSCESRGLRLAAIRAYSLTLLHANVLVVAAVCPPCYCVFSFSISAFIHVLALFARRWLTRMNFLGEGNATDLCIRAEPEFQRRSWTKFVHASKQLRPTWPLWVRFRRTGEFREDTVQARWWTTSDECRAQTIRGSRCRKRLWTRCDRAHWL